MMRNETHLDYFDNAVHDAYAWLDDIVAEATWDDLSIALYALRATLHALRDELTVEQNALLTAHLPTIIRGIYYEGWKPRPTDTPPTTRDRFLKRIATSLKHPYNEFDPEEMVQTILKTLSTHLPTECKKIQSTLPADLQSLWPASPFKEEKARL